MSQANSQRRCSKLSTESSKKRGVEFSKLIVIITGILFILALLDIRGAVRGGFDVSGYATQQIITTGGIFGASIIFYLNKSKIENLSKGKIRYLLIKMRLELKLSDIIPQESYQQVLEEIDELEGMLDSKLDGDLEDAIQKDIDIQQY